MMTLAHPSIRLDGLTKRFGEKPALREIDLSLHGGSVVCLLGRNGAGKTTTLRTIMGLTTPTDGEVWINGVPVGSEAIHRARRSIGYLAEEPILYDALTGREFLQFIGELYGVSSRVLASLGPAFAGMEMTEVSDDPVRSYSMGMRKKLAFLAATLHDPGILVLDEPTGGLDASSARVVKDTMIDYRDRGRLVLFSTHVLEIAERWADRIAILSQGRLVFDGPLSELRRRHGSGGNAPESLESVFLRITARA